MLTNTAYLVINDGSDTAAFKFEQFEPTHAVDKRFLLGGNRGEIIGELVDFLPQINSANTAGYVIDVGLGEETFEYQVTLDVSDSPPWGVVDNNFDPVFGGGSGKKTSAHDGDPFARAEILAQWVRGTVADSTDATGEAKLYKGNWTDGTFANSPGIFGEPIPVAPSTVEIRRTPDDPSEVILVVELIRLEKFPDLPDTSNVQGGPIGGPPL
jgi:hypothetical protein